MKSYFVFLTTIALCNYGFAQSLTIRDFRNARNNLDAIKNKRFILISSSDSVNKEVGTWGTHKFSFYKSKANELCDILLSQDSEGAQKCEINYYLISKAEYNNFIISFKKTSLIIAKRCQCYTIFLGTYAGEGFYDKGLVLYKGKKYYCIRYNYSAGKELAAPYEHALKDSMN